jgi:ABC-type uncharacterized transport system permease subunit
MDALVGIFQPILPILYGLLLFGFANVFFRQSVKRKWLFPLVILTLLSDAIYIGSYTKAAGHCLYTNFYELFALIAFVLLLIYAMVEVRREHFSVGTGLMVVLVGFVFQLVSSLNTTIDIPGARNELFGSPMFNVHIITVVFGYAALTLATIYGSLYLLLYRAMRKNSFGSFFHEIPSLDKLEKFGVRASGIGFGFLTVSIVAGSLLVRKLVPGASAINYFLDPKTLATILIWAVFGSTLLLHRLKRLEGKRIVIFWMSGFALVLISMTVINSFVTEFHNFL